MTENIKAEFTVRQVAVLCGGTLPESNGFNWKDVYHFELEDGVLQPYAGTQLLPGPGIRITVHVQTFPPQHDHASSCPVYPDGELG